MHCPGDRPDLLIHKLSSMHIRNLNPTSQLQSAAELGPDSLGEPTSLSLSAGHTEEKRAGLKSVYGLIVFIFPEALQQCNAGFSALTSQNAGTCCQVHVGGEERWCSQFLQTLALLFSRKKKGTNFPDDSLRM